MIPHVSNDDDTFNLIKAEAERLFISGQPGAAQPIIDDLARVQAEEEAAIEAFLRRKRLRIEAAIELEERAGNIAGVVDKLFLWAGIEGKTEFGAIATFVFIKACDYTMGVVQAESLTRLLIAKAIYEALLDRLPREQDPHMRARTQNNLGVVLKKLSERLDGEAASLALTQAEAAFDATRHVWTRKNFPYEWARREFSFGKLWKIKGQRLEGVAAIYALKRARQAFDAALEVRTREEYPTDWANTCKDIAELARLGFEKTGDNRYLIEGTLAAGDALVVFREAEYEDGIKACENLISEFNALTAAV